jgi:hypothetical protein
MRNPCAKSTTLGTCAAGTTTGVGAHARGIARGAPVKTTLAGAGFAEPAHWGVHSPPPSSGHHLASLVLGWRRPTLSVKLRRTSSVVGRVTIGPWWVASRVLRTTKPGAGESLAGVDEQELETGKVSGLRRLHPMRGLGPDLTVAAQDPTLSRSRARRSSAWPCP